MFGYRPKILGLLLFVIKIYYSNAVDALLKKNAILTCPFHPAAWMKDISVAWQQLRNDTKYENVNTSQLTIRNVDVTDSGQYFCVSINQGYVIYLNVIVVTSVSTVLTCPFSSSNYEWKRYTQNNWTTLLNNDGKYGNVNANQLTIFNVDALDNGHYNCTRGIYPGTPGDIFLHVIVMPLNVNVLNQTYLATIGGNVTLDCTIIGYPVASDIWWTKSQGIRLNGNRYSGGNQLNPSLTIKNLIESDTGKYTCHATNTAGTNSQSTQLKTGYIPYAEVARKQYVLKTGETVTVECKVTNADVVQWYKDDSEISKSTKYNFSAIQKQNLIISDVRPTDRGRYECRVTNKFGDYSDDTVLKIVDKPLVNTFEENIQATVGEDVIIQCSFDSYPEPTDVSWMKDGHSLTLQDGAKYNGSTVNIPSLTIYNVNNADSGVYVCYVENSLGRSSGRYVTLHVAIKEPSKSSSIIGPVAGGISGGIVAVGLVVVVLYIYTTRKWTNRRQNSNYETCDNTKGTCKFELHLYDKTQRPNSIDITSPVYVNTANELISCQSDKDTAFTMYDAQDFMRILQDKSSLSKHIRKEYKVLKSMSILGVAGDYEIVDIKTGTTTVDEYTHQALIKKHDDGSGYIITTVPDQSDIDDFWTMITNYHVGYIVLPLQEVEKISEFFPNTIEPIRTHSFKVEICAFEKIRNSIFEFVLDISKKDKKTVEQVKLYKTTDWKVGQTYPSIDTMCELLNVMSNREIARVSLIGCNGVSCPVCGILGVCHEVLHAINNKKDLNMLQIAVRLKHIRPDLFQTFEEYNLCYKVINRFLQNEHTYAVID